MLPVLVGEPSPQEILYENGLSFPASDTATLSEAVPSIGIVRSGPAFTFGATLAIVTAAYAGALDIPVPSVAMSFAVYFPGEAYACQATMSLPPAPSPKSHL